MEHHYLVDVNKQLKEQGTSNLLRANSDVAAIESWLNEYRKKVTTYESYKKEIKKFRIWQIVIVKKELSILDKNDFEKYIKFLQNPSDDFIIGKSTQDKKYQIFKSPLNFKSMRYNITVINSMINYLVDAKYLTANPIRLIKQFSKFEDFENRKLEVKAKILEEEEFIAIVKVLDELPEITEKERANKARTKLIFLMLYSLGLRVSELASGMWDNFKIVEDKCWYFLIGKGNKAGKIPVNDELLSFVKEYRKHQGLLIEVDKFESNWILPGKNKEQHLSARRIRSIVKNIFKLAAEKFKDEKIKNKLLSQSPHDLRHLLASNLDALGLSIIDTKEILRHSSEKITEIYRNSKDSKCHAAMQKNTSGIQRIYSKEYNKLTEITISLHTGNQDKDVFKYFINSVLDNYLKQYSFFKKNDIDALVNTYEKKSKIYQSMNISIYIKELLDSTETASICELIKRAANIRGIRLESVHSVSSKFLDLQW